MARSCCPATPGRSGNRLSLIPCLSLGVQSNGVPEFPVGVPPLARWSSADPRGIAEATCLPLKHRKAVAAFD